MILDKIKAYGFMVGCIALAGLLAVQTLRLNSEQRAHLELQTKVAQDAKARTDAALSVEIKTAQDESTHAQQTQENSDAFTTSQPVRDALHRADVARLERLRLDTERRAATYRAQAQANAAACGDLANRLASFDAHIVRGAGVVAGLGSALDRRDAEVVLLRGQIDADRALLGGAQ